ncbi:unnamed protein product [Rhizophagus irregularis]|nr:unnamed protein product [Rhizophagus irregularis]
MLAFHQSSTAFETLALLLVKPTLPPMVYPSAKEKARLNALANDDTPSSNSNQPTNDLLPRQIALPRSKKKPLLQIPLIIVIHLHLILIELLLIHPETYSATSKKEK